MSTSPPSGFVCDTAKIIENLNAPFNLQECPDIEKIYGQGVIMVSCDTGGISIFKKAGDNYILNYYSADQIQEALRQIDLPAEH